jgi:DNA ligase-1
VADFSHLSRRHPNSVWRIETQQAVKCRQMLRFARTADSIAATSGKLMKIKLVAEYLQSLPLEQAAIASVFFSGGPFPAHEQATMQVGGAMLWRVIADLSGKSEQGLSALYRRHGDAGGVAADALPQQTPSTLSLTDIEASFREIATARGPDAKVQLLRALLQRAAPAEAKYIVKIITGEMRIGLKESLVEEAIAQAFAQPVAQVQRANMLLGDIGETLRLATSGNLDQAHLRLFHPIDFMLASPVDSTEEALSYFDDAADDAAVEDKYDGIRAHAHIQASVDQANVANNGVAQNAVARLFSRTRDEITESFPELALALRSLPFSAILDGEIVAWSSQTSNDNSTAPAADAEQTSPQARALPFSTLQRRLGRKRVSEALQREVPVAYLVFDVLFADGELLLDRPLNQRGAILTDLLARPRLELAHAAPAQAKLFSAEPETQPHAPILRAPVNRAHSPEALEKLFTAARKRGNEGLMIKDLNSPYTPGRRGKSWLKMKRELATLDVVVTAVEYGHGKRIGVLSDYTFAVWSGDRLVNIGKAYSGLTDEEIKEMTDWFLAHKLSEDGLRLDVEPKIVLEVAFNNIMKSTRHESGFALRFPRIVRLRPDKPPEDADTISTVEEIFERQHEG